MYSCNFRRTVSYGKFQVSDKILENHMFQKSLRKFELFYLALCFTKAHYHYSYIEGYRVVFWDEIYSKVVF